jgi:hypothetical protein
MILSSSSTVLPFVGLMLTDEFTSLDESTEVSEVAVIAVFLPTDPNLSNLTGEQNLETQCESGSFRSSDPSPDLDLQRPELGQVGVVENPRLQR